jgi:O-antigen/teichoic acid export membrane protein
VTDTRLPSDAGSRPPPGLTGRVARGLTWTVVHTWGGQALSLLVFVILARLLAPPDFGLVALAAVFVALAQFIVDQGLGDALVQRREITKSHIDTAFWVSVATGLSLTAITFLIAWPVSAAVGVPDLVPVLQVLSVTYLLSALTSVPIALLTRELAFRLLAVRAIASIVVGGIVGIGMAIGGFGAWALVGQQVAAAAVSVVLLWAVTDWRPGMHASAEHFRDLFPFGIRVLGSDILGFVSRNADNFLIGVVLGTTPLGIYAVAYRILDVSQRLLVNFARKITFPALARLQDDSPRLRRAYLRATRVGAVLLLPGYVGLALVAPELIVTLFGSTWAESGPVSAILFLGGPVLGIQAFAGSLLYAVGRPDVVLRFRIIATVASVAAFAAAVPFGIVAVAAAFTVRGYLMLPLLLVWTRRHAGIGIGEYLAQMRGTALATLGMVVGIVALKLLLGDRLSPTGLLALEIAGGATVFVGLLALLERSVLADLWTVAGHALPGLHRLRRAQ